MKKIPKLAIVGRPNVGKSALFNRICKKRIAIVDEAEGVTRDRLYYSTELFGRPFEVIDTGGIDPRSQALFNAEVKQQAEIAIEEADAIVMVVDTVVGATELDREVANILLRTTKPVTLAVNKIDSPERENEIHNFSCLGIQNKVAVSAAHNWRIAELLEMALDKVSIENEGEDIEAPLRVAIIGRANVGKSSLLNAFLDESRTIVSPIPGTTRDSIDVSFIHKDQLFTLIDTAGIRRKHAEHEVVDKFATMRTERSIERADVCLLVLDARDGMTKQEKRIANDIEAAGKGCVLLWNKWDLVKGFRMEHCMKSIEEEINFLKHCPRLFISALTGRNLDKIFPMVFEVAAAAKRRITTHQLNTFVERAMQLNHPPMIMGKRLKIFYLAQIGIEPPQYIFFVNNPSLMGNSYKKYLYNQFRKEYGFTGVPLIFRLRKRSSRTERA